MMVFLRFGCGGSSVGRERSRYGCGLLYMLVVVNDLSTLSMSDVDWEQLDKGQQFILYGYASVYHLLRPLWTICQRMNVVRRGEDDKIFSESENSPSIAEPWHKRQPSFTQFTAIA